MKLLASFVAVVALAGCPQPTLPDPIKSVDGLEGGTIDGDLVVGALTASSVRGGAVTATSLDVSGASSLDDVTAVAVSAETVTTTTLTTQTASFATAPTLNNKAFFPEIVGVTARTGAATAAAAEASCSAQFANSHICGEAEFVTALRFFDGSVATLEGAAVAVAKAYVAATITDGVTTRDLVIDNCGNWTALADNEGAVFVEDGVQLTPGFTTSPFAHGRVAVDSDDSGRLILGFTTECAATAISLVCCE
jgi:hypothetical protein